MGIKVSLESGGSAVLCNTAFEGTSDKGQAAPTARNDGSSISRSFAADGRIKQGQVLAFASSDTVTSYAPLPHMIFRQIGSSEPCTISATNVGLSLMAVACTSTASNDMALCKFLPGSHLRCGLPVRTTGPEGIYGGFGIVTAPKISGNKLYIDVKFALERSLSWSHLKGVQVAVQQKESGLEVTQVSAAALSRTRFAVGISSTSNKTGTSTNMRFYLCGIFNQTAAQCGDGFDLKGVGTSVRVLALSDQHVGAVFQNERGVLSLHILVSPGAGLYSKLTLTSLDQRELPDSPSDFYHFDAVVMSPGTKP